LAQAQERAARDPLTGLLNRRALDERLHEALEEARRRGNAVVYCLLDLDNLKRTNDGAGHAAGDARLRELAHALARLSRAGDIVGRVGGDEFALVMVNVNPLLATASVARVNEALRLQGLGCSVGAAVFPRDGLDTATLERAADRALYVVKTSGKGAFAFA